MRKELIRPAEISCDELWELYVKLDTMERPYLWRGKELYYLESISIHHGETEYGQDAIGLELPYARFEWIDLYLKRKEDDRIIKEKHQIRVNVLYVNDKSPEELLEKYRVRIPEEKELDEAEYDGGIPARKIPEPVKLDYMGRKRRLSILYLEEYLKRYNIMCQQDKDLDTLRYTFVFREEDVPGGSVEGCIWFFKNEAEVRLYYNDTASEICRKSEHKDDLYRLLNYINARVFLACLSGKTTPQMLYTPRIYLTEDEGSDITITTIISYRFWEHARTETNDYITAYCPELLNRLAPYIFGVLSGGTCVADAINEMEKELLSEEDSLF